MSQLSKEDIDRIEKANPWYKSKHADIDPSEGWLAWNDGATAENAHLSAVIKDKDEQIERLRGVIIECDNTTYDLTVLREQLQSLQKEVDKAWGVADGYLNETREQREQLQSQAKRIEELEEEIERHKEALGRAWDIIANDPLMKLK